VTTGLVGPICRAQHWLRIRLQLEPMLLVQWYTWWIALQSQSCSLHTLRVLPRMSDREAMRNIYFADNTICRIRVEAAKY
jgi:hypothetical protein